MTETKRKPPNAGKGRPKGSVNKTTKAFKEAVLKVYQDIGGDEFFAEWAKENPTEFYKICSRLIPQEGTLNVDVTSYVMRAPEPYQTSDEWAQRNSKTIQ